jgi:hypothetical protein
MKLTIQDILHAVVYTDLLLLLGSDISETTTGRDGGNMKCIHNFGRGNL